MSTQYNTVEEWRDIMGYEGYYQVSNHGRVRSLDRTVPHINGGIKNIKGKLLAQFKLPTGYKQINLCRTGIQRCQEYVHTLVLITFNGLPPTPTHECNHKNGVKSDNHINNLEWVTHSENMIHAHHTLNIHRARGESVNGAKLTEAKVLKIRGLYTTGDYTQKELAIAFEVGQSSIGDVINRISWQHI